MAASAVTCKHSLSYETVIKWSVETSVPVFMTTGPLRRYFILFFFPVTWQKNAGGLMVSVFTETLHFLSGKPDV